MNGTVVGVAAGAGEDVAVGSGEGVAMATGGAVGNGGWLVGVAVGGGAGVSVGVEVAVGRVWTPGWLVAHLIGMSRRSTEKLRVCGPCMMWSVPPTSAPISRYGRPRRSRTCTGPARRESVNV